MLRSSDLLVCIDGVAADLAGKKAGADSVRGEAGDECDDGCEIDRNGCTWLC